MHFSIYKSILFPAALILFSFPLFATHPIINSTFSPDIVLFEKGVSAIAKNESPSVGNSSEFAAEENSDSEKILVVLVDAYGSQNYSKVVITDVDMELSILIAKDIFDKLPGGIYTIVASSANDLISQKLIIQ